MMKAVLLFSVAFFAIPNEQLPTHKDGSEMQVASLCFLKGEQTSGMKKICYYRCLTGTVAITIDRIKLCPLTIND